LGATVIVDPVKAERQSNGATAELGERTAAIGVVAGNLAGLNIQDVEVAAVAGRGGARARTHGNADSGGLGTLPMHVT